MSDAPGRPLATDNGNNLRIDATDDLHDIDDRLALKVHPQRTDVHVQPLGHGGVTSIKLGRFAIHVQIDDLQEIAAIQHVLDDTAARHQRHRVAAVDVVERQIVETDVDGHFERLFGDDHAQLVHGEADYIVSNSILGERQPQLDRLDVELQEQVGSLH